MLITETQTSVTSDHQTLFPSTSFPSDGPTRAWLSEKGYIIAEKSVEDLASEARLIRNDLLRDTDKLGLTDRPIMSEEWVTYRQQLRDITAQENFPHLVTWPVKPI
jgi:hypothetical protein